MFYGYRFDSSGNYHRPDELATVQDVYDYVIAHKPHYPRVKVTDRGTDYIQVEAINGQIEFPKQWALLEIQQTILHADIFNARAFCEAMHRAGFTGFPIPTSRLEAESILRSFYEALPDPSQES